MTDRKSCSFCQTPQAITLALDNEKLQEILKEAMGKELGSFLESIFFSSKKFIICRSCISSVKKICDTKEKFLRNLAEALPQTTCSSVPNCTGDASADHSYSVESETLHIEPTVQVNKTVIDHSYMINNTWIPSINSSFKAELIKELKLACADLTTKKIEKSSVLLQKKGIKHMVQREDVINEIFQEVKERFPFLLLEILSSVAHKNDNVPIKYGHISAAYVILMSAREAELSLFQRLTSIICIREHMEDMGFARLNKFGLTMSTSTKLRLLDECGDLNSLRLKRILKTVTLLKLTGDNLDVYIKTGNLTTVNRNTDVHLFASNAISCRIATPDMSTKAPKIDELQLQATDVLLNEARLEVLKEAIIVLVI
ncbi:unnamed protein product [Mytilus coruscus]|uniref:ZAD domain-containing protein n=1 Tax=Mytilus coruscus TaxID=42192 RepID=A0A6J8DF31_MYTCO|nr:unnamed protein product [Mytilus coruscus]